MTFFSIRSIIGSCFHHNQLPAGRFMSQLHRILTTSVFVFLVMIFKNYLWLFCTFWGGADPVFLPFTMDHTSWWIQLDEPTDDGFWIIHSFIIHWCCRGCWETKFDVTDKNHKTIYYVTSRNFSILQCPWVTYGSSARIFLFWSEQNYFSPVFMAWELAKTGFAMLTV